MYLNRKAVPLHIESDKLPVYKTPPKDKGASSGKAVSEKDIVVPLVDTIEIKRKVLESHTLFEEYYSMYPGVRNNNLFVLASFFYNDGIPKDFATDYLIAYYSNSENGFTSDEIRQIVHSAYH